MATLTERHQPATTTGGRVAVTLGAPFVVWLVAGFNSPWSFPYREFIAKDTYGLGLSPVVIAFLLVELAAAVMPPWRALRVNGPEGRATLTRAAWRLSAVVMAWELMVIALQFGASLSSISMWLVMLLLMNAGWTLALVFIARLVSRAGLVNGYALLLALDFIPYGFFTESPRGSLFPVVAMLGLVGISAAVLASRGATQTEGELTLRAPLSGITPLLAVMVLVAQPLVRGPEFFRYLPHDLPEIVAGTPVGIVVSMVLVGLFTVGFSHLFNRSSLMQSWVPDGVGPRVRERFKTALAHTLLFLLCITLGTQLLQGEAYLALFAAVPSAICFAALVLDAVAERRARATLGHLVPVWWEQRSYALGPLSAALTNAGIAHHVRSARLRALLPHVPLVPAELLVAPAQADAALATLTARNSNSVVAVQGHAPSTF